MTDINKTLAERQRTYGNFEGHAKIAQNLKQTMQLCPRWRDLRPEHKEALEMIQHKIARILNGNPDHKDSWHDITGYATLIEKQS